MRIRNSANTAIFRDPYKYMSEACQLELLLGLHFYRLIVDYDTLALICLSVHLSNIFL